MSNSNDKNVTESQKREVNRFSCHEKIYKKAISLKNMIKGLFFSPKHVDYKKLAELPRQPKINIKTEIYLPKIVLPKVNIPKEVKESFQKELERIREEQKGNTRKHFAYGLRF